MQKYIQTTINNLVHNKQKIPADSKIMHLNSQMDREISN